MRRWEDRWSGRTDHDVPMPAVIEPETFGTEDEQAPTVLWTPVAAPVSEGEDPVFVLRVLEDGQRAMLVFTSPRAFVDGCGDQPHLSFRAEAVQVFQQLAEADVVLWDPVLAPQIRQEGSYMDGGVDE